MNDQDPAAPGAREPRTKAGQAMLDLMRDHAPWFLGGSREAECAAVAAIEDEAAALDVDRLERAMRWAGIRAEPDFATLAEAARQLAGDYASPLLAPSPDPSPMPSRLSR